MEVQKTSTSTNLTVNVASDPGTNEKSYAQLESVDYNRLYREHAQLQPQDQHQVPPYVHSGQLVSMSGVIENGQFIPIQLNAIPRSISINSIRHPESRYQQTNENQLYNPSVIAYHRSSPNYEQNTNVQASPPILISNTLNDIPPEQNRTKRGHHDVSSSTNNNISSHEEGWQTVHRSKKFTTGSNNIHPQIHHNQTPYTKSSDTMADSNNQVSLQAQKYATTRYPFSPFVAHFKDNVRDKLVVEHLVNHVKQQFGFDLRIISYRRSQINCSQGEYDVLVFVETTDSFEFLFDDAHWPSQLVGKDFRLKKPSIPPQLSAVIQNVSLDIDWEDFVTDLQAKYPDIVKVIRLKNRKLQNLKSVKIEIKSVKIRNEILEQNYISIANMRYNVAEYFALANVLICSRCRGIGHFQKNCPQQDQVTCKTCGEKFISIKDHACSGVPKCIHCGDAHCSNDSKCRIIKDYRAALTRSLLSKLPSPDTNMHPNLPLNLSSQPSSINSVTPKTIDMNKILEKMEEEGEKTRSTIESLKVQMLELDSENKHRISQLSEQLDINEQKVRDLQSTITSLGDKFATQQQTIEYVLYKAENTESKFSNYRLELNVLLKSIIKLFVLLRESKLLPIPDDFLSLFHDKTNKLERMN